MLYKFISVPCNAYNKVNEHVYCSGNVLIN